MNDLSREELIARIIDLEERLEEADQHVEAIKNGEVDAFAIHTNNKSEIYTLQSGDYTYRLLIEQFSEGAVNVTDEGLIIYTNNYFCELTGLPYDKIVGTDISAFIAEDSRDKFDQLFKAALKGKGKGEIYLAINQLIIPVYVSLTSLQPNLPAIGIIVTDLTARKKTEQTILQYQEELEKNNELLKQSNIELASFAYVASHDLQEPLRKINSFTNMILDFEMANMSEKSRNYFDRILDASTRMRVLISELLNYSRINNSEAVFTPTDLNELVKEVIEDNTDLLQQENVLVETGSLPDLSVIPFQIRQLFSNLITNAAKFHAKDLQPLIRVDSELLPAGHSLHPEPLSQKSFYRIAVSDNGIGFDQQYASKIFELFQRLHTRSEYEGTGIGLAICKKIMQNHGGYIQATSVPGSGSTFSIYFPMN